MLGNSTDDLAIPSVCLGEPQKQIHRFRSSLLLHLTSGSPECAIHKGAIHDPTTFATLI
jgi:hypothetical protein